MPNTIIYQEEKEEKKPLQTVSHQKMHATFLSVYDDETELPKDFFSKILPIAARNCFFLYYRPDGNPVLYQGGQTKPIKTQKIPLLKQAIANKNSIDKYQIQSILNNHFNPILAPIYKTSKQAQLALKAEEKNLKELNSRKDNLSSLNLNLKKQMLQSSHSKKSYWKYSVGIGLSLVLCATGALSIIGVFGFIISTSLLISSMMCGVGGIGTIGFSLKRKDIISKNLEITDFINDLSTKIKRISRQLISINSQIKSSTDKITSLKLKIEELQGKEKKEKEICDVKNQPFASRVTSNVSRNIKSLTSSFLNKWSTELPPEANSKKIKATTDEIPFITMSSKIIEQHFKP